MSFWHRLFRGKESPTGSSAVTGSTLTFGTSLPQHSSIRPSPERPSQPVPSRAQIAATGDEIATFIDAVKGGDLRKVKALIKSNPTLVLNKDNTGTTALHWAAKCGRTNLAKSLLANKANANAKDAEGMTPLHWAAKKGYTDFVQLLREHGAEESPEPATANSTQTAKSHISERESGRTSAAPPVNVSGSGDEKPSDRKERRLLEIGIQALKKSLVVAEVSCKDKAAAQDLVADEAKLTAVHALGEAAGTITGDNCLEALRAFRRGDYEIVERGKAEFVVEFIGMHQAADEPIEDTILAEIEDRIYLCMASQLLDRLAAGRGKPNASEQLNEFVEDKLDMLAGRVMPKYGLSQEQFGELFVKAYRRCLNRPATHRS